ncbi:hypothetical protein BC6307_04620 [Sutcliffiella cohnii]|uniref:Uncharacterized protein n=1 Tax=Sutcliffiella cohnii TaxID=33932 RepID=A0A223KMR3_9BACI|nr:hypothetical protein BC6307_04620 [Sutcliffiella cohnii]
MLNFKKTTPAYTKSGGGSLRSNQTGAFPQEIKETQRARRRVDVDLSYGGKVKFEPDLAAGARQSEKRRAFGSGVQTGPFLPEIKETQRTSVS